MSRRTEQMAQAREDRRLREQPHYGTLVTEPAPHLYLDHEGVIQDSNWRRRLAKAKPGQRVYMHPLVSYKPKSREA